MVKIYLQQALIYNWINRTIQVIIFAFLACAEIMSQEGGIVATLPSGQIVVPPGKHASFVLMLENTSSDTLFPEFTDILPPDMSVLMARKPERLLPSEKSQIIYSLAADAYARSRSENLTIKVKAEKIQPVTFVIPLEIERKHLLEIQRESCPKFVLGLDSIACTYTVTNKGNAAEELEISSINGTASIQSIILHPQDKKTIRINQRADDPVKHQITQNNYVLVKMKSLDTIFNLSSTISVFPRVVKRSPSFHKIPLSLENRYRHWIQSDADHNYLNHLLRGGGQLGANSNHQAFFTISLTSIENTPYLRETRSVSFLDYRFKNWNLILGNQELPFSNSIEMLNNGPGISLSLNSKFHRVKLFHLTFTEYGQALKWSGLYTEFQISPNQTFNISTIVKHEGDERSNLLSVATEFQKNKFSLELDQGIESSANKLLFSTYLLLGYNGDRLKLGFNGRYKSHNTLTKSQKTKVLSSNASFIISKSLSLSVVHGLNQSQLSLFDLIYKVQRPFSHRISSFLRLRIARHSNVRLGYVRTAKTDRNEVKLFDYTESGIQFAYYFYQNSFSGSITSRILQTQNHLLANVEDGQYERQSTSHNIQLQFRPSRNVQIQANANYSHTSKFAPTLKTDKLFFYGGIVSLKKNALGMNISYRNKLSLDQIYEPKSFLTGSLQWTGKNIRLSLDYKRLNRPGSNEQETYLGFNSILNMAMPVSRLKGQGVVKGQIKRFKSFSGSQGLLVRIGDRVQMTDSDGKFVFYDLKPGEYNLDIDASSLELHELIDSNLPQFLMVGPDETKVIELKTVTASKIGGKLDFQRSKQTESQFFTKSNPIVIVKLENSQTSLLTESDLSGTFSFDNLRPGKYRLSLVQTGWEKDYQVEEKEFEIHLEAGEINKLKLELKQKKRKMKMVKSKVQLKSKS